MSKQARELAESIGVSSRWVQNPGTWREHYDICLAKRKLAIDAGAKEITMVELVRMLQERRTKKRL